MSNNNFWTHYYKHNTDDILHHSSFSDFIYHSYIRPLKYTLQIADLGSGNCRDSIFFANMGHPCFAIDANGVLKDTSNPMCVFIKDDVEDVLKHNRLHTLLDMVYMRWFLHAMPYDKSASVFQHAVQTLKPNGFVCVEVRSINDTDLVQKSVYDETDQSYTTTHKRWLYSVEQCKALAIQNQCEVLYCEEDHFSPNKHTETQNPLLIRMICQKKNNSNV